MEPATEEPHIHRVRGWEPATGRAPHPPGDPAPPTLSVYTGRKSTGNVISTTIRVKSGLQCRPATALPTGGASSLHPSFLATDNWADYEARPASVDTLRRFRDDQAPAEEEELQDQPTGSAWPHVQAPRYEVSSDESNTSLAGLFTFRRGDTLRCPSSTSSSASSIERLGTFNPPRRMSPKVEGLFTYVVPKSQCGSSSSEG